MFLFVEGYDEIFHRSRRLVKNNKKLWTNDVGRTTKEDTVRITAVKLYPIPSEWDKNCIWSISTQVKWGSLNVSEVTKNKVYNGIGSLIV